MKRSQKWLPGLLAGGLVAGAAVVGFGAPVAPVVAQSAAPTDLILSEYVEGSSNNKAVELYNGTDAEIGLSGYSLDVYFNANTSPTSIPLTGAVPAGGTFVFAHSTLGPSVGAQQTSGAGLWNGNDTIVLARDGVVVDSFGQIALNANFEGGGLSALNSTLRRAASVCTGDTDPNDAFDPSAEWVGFAEDTFDGLGGHSTECGDVEPVSPVINEFSASTTGTDVEYIEIYGDPNTDLSNLTVLEIEGDSGGEGTVDGEWSIGDTDDDGFHLVDLPSNALENGTITLLLVDGYSGGATNVADIDGTVIDAVAINDGGADDVTYGEPVLVEQYDGLNFTPGGASRIPDGVDTDTTADWVRNDFDLAGILGETGSLIEGEAANTPGAANSTTVPDPDPDPDPTDCTTADTPIGAVQGSGDASPLVGATATVQGIVTGALQPGGFDGYYLQDAGDGDPATSDAIFVFAPGGSEVVEGEEVQVTGTVDESFTLTQLTNVSIARCSLDNELPAPVEVSLPFDAEPFEGMHVTLPQDLVITEFFNFDRYGEMVLATERQQQPSAVLEPGSPELAALAAANATNRITLDDGLDFQNPDPLRHPNGAPFGLGNAFRGGDTVTDATGVLDYRFSLWRIQPTAPAVHTAVNDRPLGAPEVGGSLKVVGFNVLNFFQTLDTNPGSFNGPDICGPSLDTECRGASSGLEYERQLAKLLAALEDIDADVFGFAELENSDGVDPMAPLVEGLNALPQYGPGVWASVDTGTIGTDVIRVGMMYRTDRVAVIGSPSVLDSSVDPLFDDTRNRPSLAVSIEELATGGEMTVVVNHWKSKGSCPSSGPDADAGDGASCWNASRTDAATAVVNWLAGHPTGIEDDDYLIFGDLNSYAQEDPIDVLRDAGYVDAVDSRHPGAYSYVFDGQWGTLDYAFASQTLDAQITGADDYHINADEPDAFDYNTDFRSADQIADWYAPDRFRTSDHDPALVGIELTPSIPVGECFVDYTVRSTWPGGFIAGATITNTGDTSIHGWELAWSFTAGESVAGGWGGGFTASGSDVTVADAGWNRTIAPGGSRTVGFVGTRDVALPAIPEQFLLNGELCGSTEVPEPTPLECAVDYSVGGSWPGGFLASARITNTGDSPIAGWELEWAFSAGESVVAGWNGSFDSTGAEVTVSDVGWNSVIQPGASRTIGFVGARGGQQPAVPAAFAVNGVPCDG